MLLTAAAAATPNIISQRKLVHRSAVSDNLIQPVRSQRDAKVGVTDRRGPITRIREMFNKVELSVSAYDTAWVAMVPSQDSSSDQPCFPECLNWIMENQQPDGSWGLDPTDPLLVKDSLSSTLASVLALRQWNVGDQLVQKGLDFIVSNLWSAVDRHQRSPIGFDIIFPGMIEHARNTGLNVPSSLNVLLPQRDFEIKRLEGNTRHLAYIAEGLTGLKEWEEVMKYQRSNGSLFNSPSTTAAAYIHTHNGKSYEYLQSLGKRFNNAVPTVYPFDIYTHLCLVDKLERLGIARYFKREISRVLDDVHRCWKQGSEEIFSNPPCFAMAFRFLRMHGYKISSDVLADFTEQESFLREAREHTADTKAILELYRASLTSTSVNEPVLDRIQSWTGMCLKELRSTGAVQDNSVVQEVDYALRYPQDTAERIGSRKKIENYSRENVQLLKTSYRCVSIDDRDLLRFAVKDFNMCQAIHRKELADLERWFKEYGLENIKSARQKTKYAYFSVATIIPDPNLSDARIAWCQYTVLTTIIDDLIDSFGSMEEILNLIELVERWDDYSAIGFRSRSVEVIFTALYETTNELGAKASIQQGRNVRSHLKEMLITTIKCMLREAEWATEMTLPTLDEYLSNGCITTALGPIVLVPLYFLGKRLPEEVVASEEYKSLFKHMSMCARLLNDVQSYKRELEERTPNCVTLQMLRSNGAVTEEEAKEEIMRLIEGHKRELLRLVVQKKGSVVPKVCKDVLWLTLKITYVFYTETDGFSSPTDMVSVVNKVLDEPIILPS